MKRGRGKGVGRADEAKKDVVCILAKCVENCAPGVGYLSIPGRAELSKEQRRRGKQFLSEFVQRFEHEPRP